MSKIEASAAPFSYDGLDRVIHEKARLGLLTSLMAHPKGLAFADLKQLCGLTDGNLSRHLGVLQEAGLVEVTKGWSSVSVFVTLTSDVAAEICGWSKPSCRTIG